MYVYRSWTTEDIRKATEGITHPKIKMTAFEEGIRGLYNSYRLNGVELERAICQKWGQIGV